MTNPISRRLGRAGEAILYLVLAWIALAAIILALPWAPVDAFQQSARIVALFVSAVVLLVSVVCAAIGMLGIFWAAPQDPAPRP